MCFLVNGLDSGIHAKLRYFETLKTVSIASRRRRTTDGNYQNSKEISFQAFGRNFCLVLYPGTPVLASDFYVRAVDRYGMETPYHVQPNDFFLGHLKDDASVKVEAHFEDGILSSSTEFHNETYIVEPAWRHLPTASDHMIVYRGSDMTDGEGTMSYGSMKPLNQEHLDPKAPGDQNGHPRGRHSKNRHRRASGWKKSCSLVLVADYLFYSTVGRTVSGTANYLIGIVTRIDQRFRNTRWDSDLTGFGFHVKELLIHTEYTDVAGHYNEDKNKWEHSDKLTKFSALENLRTVCLGHLYTSYSFERGVVGLAATASPSKLHPGGICSTKQFSYHPYAGFNTGFTSARDANGHMLVARRFELVNMHELGHGWGSEHDPETGECAPKSEKNGKYLMWPVLGHGYEGNNFFFSPCSKRWILNVLKSKSQTCFTDKTEAVCGNGLLDDGEECDHHGSAEDECCTTKCTLKPGAICSDLESVCCRHCRASPKGTKCADENRDECKDKSYCNGQDYDVCPPPQPSPDDASCMEDGKCYKGKCSTFCEIQGMRANKTLRYCVCEQNETAACRFCCMEVPNGLCEPTQQFLPDGDFCISGSCVDGVCSPPETNIVLRFFNYIQSTTSNAFEAVMETNIVGIVMVLSAVVWVVGSVIISRKDKKHVEAVRQSRLNQPKVSAMLQEEPDDKPAEPALKAEQADHRVIFLEPSLVATDSPHRTDFSVPALRDKDSEDEDSEDEPPC
ncbi:hypothetical protein BaRGS_00020826 [Batillaria attramentaria]|uniref:ADAM 17-like protease n=1 Tax=Batillaria attramentaria TaxID=370345 RepID=A0ABD0KLQ7_9CAEN